ncbi:hypothetical protein CTAM01_16038 [Colletotrichum tamarilloi]|uniref:Uncharacterized protein n=1 Tax=Colletotrichum tamarilloi TaxID=1209934 RepID=A0ABQ9QJN4_9PEZI|nr:uncharacterized protein CTAM01_16038 [Colletotrichum tamarilloi]KAK1474009.1 hypothetical protein CTAM01_16038 [Colletotrichum tamarilloi]
MDLDFVNDSMPTELQPHADVILGPRGDEMDPARRYLANSEVFVAASPYFVCSSWDPIFTKAILCDPNKNQSLAGIGRSKGDGRARFSISGCLLPALLSALARFLQ